MNRRQKAAGGGSCADSLLSMMIAALLRVGADQSAVKSVAKSIIRDRPIPAHCDMQKYADEEAQIFIDRDRLSNRLMREEDNVGKGIARYIRTFGKEPYFGLPIGEMSLSDQIKEIQRQIQVLNDAFSSGRPIPDEPMQQMGAGLPPPIFCTGPMNCAIASMLSLVSTFCFILGYTGDAPQRSFSIQFGENFKESVLGFLASQCIVVEDIFKHLREFLDLLEVFFPQYSPYLGKIFSIFSSTTFRTLTNGACVPIEDGVRTISMFTILDEKQSESDQEKPIPFDLSLEEVFNLKVLLGEEKVLSQTYLDPKILSAFALPCAMINDHRGLIHQVGFTDRIFRPFICNGPHMNGTNFVLTQILSAVICDTRGRNQAISPVIDDGDNTVKYSSEEWLQRVARSAGTSHYYLVICKDDVWFLVDSNRTNVQVLSREVVLQHVNVNGIMIFMCNDVEQRVQEEPRLPQRVAKIASLPHSPQKSSTDRADVPEQPAQSSRKPSASGGGAAAVPCHQYLPSFEHMQVQSRKIIDGSNFPIMDHDGAFYDVMRTHLQTLPQSGCPSTCKVTGLSLVLDDLCKHNVQIFGSFRVRKGSVNYRYRVTSVRFDDNSEVKFLHSFDDFMDAIDAKWQQSLITSVTLEECSE